jgi:hypothetical protein
MWSQTYWLISGIGLKGRTESIQCLPPLSFSYNTSQHFNLGFLYILTNSLLLPDPLLVVSFARLPYSTPSSHNSPIFALSVPHYHPMDRHGACGLDCTYRLSAYVTNALTNSQTFVSISSTVYLGTTEIQCRRFSRGFP